MSSWPGGYGPPVSIAHCLANYKEGVRLTKSLRMHFLGFLNWVLNDCTLYFIAAKAWTSKKV